MLRNYRPEDLDKLVAIADRAWQPIQEAYRRAYGDDLFNLLFPTPETRVGEDMRREIDQHPDQVLVYEQDGRVVAFIIYYLEQGGRIGVIGRNAVDPAHQGKGISSTLYEAVLEVFRKQDAQYARVTTGLDDGHAPARRAYQRVGFNIHHSLITYYRRL